MPSTASQLAALGNDLQFQLRVRSIVLQVAVNVSNEAPQDPDTRRNFARMVLQNPEQAQRSAIAIANTTNVIAGTTTYDFESGHVKNDITDAALFAQITAAWDLISGNI